MGLEFGNLPIRIRRILYYSLSPREQRAWAKSVSHGIPNMGSRTLRLLGPMMPGALYANYRIVKSRSTSGGNIHVRAATHIRALQYF